MLIKTLFSNKDNHQAMYILFKSHQRSNKKEFKILLHNPFKNNFYVKKILNPGWTLLSDLCMYVYIDKTEIAQYPCN